MKSVKNKYIEKCIRKNQNVSSKHELYKEIIIIANVVICLSISLIIITWIRINNDAYSDSVKTIISGLVFTMFLVCLLLSYLFRSSVKNVKDEELIKNIIYDYKNNFKYKSELNPKIYQNCFFSKFKKSEKHLKISDYLKVRKIKSFNYSYKENNGSILNIYIEETLCRNDEEIILYKNDKLLNMFKSVEDLKQITLNNNHLINNLINENYNILISRSINEVVIPNYLIEIIWELNTCKNLEMVYISMNNIYLLINKQPVNFKIISYKKKYLLNLSKIIDEQINLLIKINNKLK